MYYNYTIIIIIHMHTGIVTHCSAKSCLPVPQFSRGHQLDACNAALDQQYLSFSLRSFLATSSISVCMGMAAAFLLRRSILFSSCSFSSSIAAMSLRTSATLNWEALRDDDSIIMCDGDSRNCPTNREYSRECYDMLPVQTDQCSVPWCMMNMNYGHLNKGDVVESNT